ncbi:hypothetical protein EDD21DRAFT_418602 [Dissophora ornata]|nr:hypothetical protein EDD21DRAFT_418602 [Dissophora ornata]
MAQAGAESQSPALQDHNESTFRNSPGNRSLASSPGPGSSSPLSRISRPYSNDIPGVSSDYSMRLQLNLSPVDLSMDTNSLLARSPSSHSSLSGGGSFRNTASSGYTSGTSSTYSSLGRKRSDSITPPVIPSTLNGGLLRADSGSAADSPLLSYRRPSSALSIHSYNSSGAASPVPDRQDQYPYGDFKSGQDNNSMGREQDGVENTSESTLHGLRRSRSRSVIGLDSLSSQHGSRSGTPSHKIPSLDKYPTSSVEADLAAHTKKLSLSSTTAESVQQKTEPQQGSVKTIMGRPRSHSSVPTPTPGTVKARTESYMAKATNSPPTARSHSHVFNNSSQNLVANRVSTVFNHPPKQQTTVTSPVAATVLEKDFKDSRSALPLEQEPNTRSSLRRHGRQRSNTVGEAISSPVVSVDSGASPTMQRAGSIPDGHCHKCLERVTENGVRLQNGDRYHISCFLCHGCKQVFTESEFHVVLGRPYHPSCVSMAGPTSTMGVVTKCQKCHKVVTNKSIRFSGLNYHPQCFSCTHCNKVLNSTSRFYEVDGQVECEQCCDERDKNGARLPPPKIVPVPRTADHFPLPAMASTSPAMRRSSVVPLEPSGPGMMATNANANANANASMNLSRSGSGNGSGYGSPRSISGASSPLRSPGSPSSSSLGSSSPINIQEQGVINSMSGSGAASPVLMMTSPVTQRATPPALTSFFGTRTRPLPKFGGVTTCPRCHQAVGVMDQVPGPKNEKWHKKCLNCKECKKVLDSSALTRGEGEAFCRGCYNKTRK